MVEMRSPEQAWRQLQTSADERSWLPRGEITMAAGISSNRPAQQYAVAERIAKRPVMERPLASEPRDMFEKTKGRRLANVAAIGAVALVTSVADIVVARGPNVGSPYEILSPSFASVAPTTRQPSETAGPGRPHRTIVVGLPVCVRLCDGAFFPIAVSSGTAEEEALCRNLCPDAETAVYREPNGSNDIDGAISRAGKPYSELPTALRYRTTLDGTCVCHHDLAPHYSIAQDSTLRKGDYVMTPKGFVVFAGASRLPHRASDFVAIAKAQIPATQRSALQSMEGPHPLARRGSVRITTP